MLIGSLDPTKASAVIPAFNEEERIAATIEALSHVASIDLVVVVDDGSSDNTAKLARGAGAQVFVGARNSGKAAALQHGADTVLAWEVAAHIEPRPLVFLDADLADSAAHAELLLGPVFSGTCDVSIATLPTQRSAGGGSGFVVRLAQAGIEQATGRVMRQPLSGQRALRRAAFEAAYPLAAGWGVEVGMTIDVLRGGFAVLEVDVPFHHRVTGTDWRAQLHRGRQYYGVWQALRQRGVGPRFPIPK